MNKLMYRFIVLSAFLLLSISTINAQRGLYEKIDYDKVKFDFDDFGKMWTFDDIPMEYWKEKYGFEPTSEWLEHVQKSALQFGRGCSGAFVSGDGLIMTNHHCGRGALPGLSEEDENLLKNGFYAETLEDERKVDGLFVDQLILIENVTDEIISAMNEGSTDEEKVNKRKEKISELEAKFSEDTGLRCQVVTLYNGGKYSLHGYKRYNDIRLVMGPDFQIAATGWDWDNFTYPRYELDFMFYRAYDENGEPIKSDDYFSWSKNGADKDELVFTVGRPGSTDRLLSVAEIEYLRDKTYPQRLLLYNEIYKVYFKLFHERPEEESILLNAVMGYGNGRKSYAGRLMGLQDPYIMKKKVDFENSFKQKVQADAELNKKYGKVWDAIELLINEKRQYSDRAAALGVRYSNGGPVYLTLGASVLKYAEQVALDEDERMDAYKSDNLDSLKKSIFPKDLDKKKEDLLMRAFINYIVKLLGEDDPIVVKSFGGKSGNEGLKYLINNSKVTTNDGVQALLKLRADELEESSDPVISLLNSMKEEADLLNAKINEIDNTLEVQNQLLGELFYKVYGDKVPPEATATLRISDGQVKGYEYNGTIAPAKTTYYGLYDRYYSFNQKTYPWGLHERWLNPPKELDLKTYIGFASTNDIVGGNSGSSIINQNAEVIGLAHDGNLESLPGHIIYLPENNRTVATDSQGLLEALKYIFKTDRLVDELQSGQL